MKFSLEQAVTTTKGEAGVITDRGEHVDREPDYQVKFADGAQRWVNESELVVPAGDAETQEIPVG